MNEILINETELILRLKEGDHEAFKFLYENYAPVLQSFSSRFNFSKHETEEIVQETFIRIWQHKQNIDPDRPFNTFLITIAKNLIYNQIRHGRYVEKYIKEIRGEPEGSYNAAHGEGELKQMINNALPLLPQKCREIFMKSRLEGASNQDIATELNISKSTVENQLNKGLKIVRAYLQKHGLGTILLFLIIYYSRLISG
ncbi:MAG: RNA polymerase sigma-70 factor [Bacteroidetes bacterium]|nr:RNA polymerase sigma-70 factor [Bacteroidota bacterium]